MKAEAWIFVICSAFFVLVAPAYWLIARDPTGSSALVMTALLLATLIMTAAAGLGFTVIVVGIRRDDAAMSHGAASPDRTTRLARRVTGLRMWTHPGLSSRAARPAAPRPDRAAGPAPRPRCGAR